MIANRNPSKARVPSNAEIRNEYDEDGSFDIDNGAAVRLEGAGRQGSMVFIARVNGIPLRITKRDVSIETDVPFKLSSALKIKQSTIEKAFSYLHNEYETEVENQCMGCSRTYMAGEEKPCGCPVGGMVNEITYPDVEPRRPRLVLDGQLLVKP